MVGVAPSRLVAMGLREKLEKEHGRPPHEHELAAAREKRDAKRKAEKATPTESVAKMCCVLGKEGGQPHELELGTGPMSKVKMILSYTSSSMHTTLEEVRAKAAMSFAGTSDSFWQIFMGESLEDYNFVASDAAWAEQTKIVLLEGNIKHITLYAREVRTSPSTFLCVPSASALPLALPSLCLRPHPPTASRSAPRNERRA